MYNNFFLYQLHLLIEIVMYSCDYPQNPIVFFQVFQYLHQFHLYVYHRYLISLLTPLLLLHFLHLDSYFINYFIDFFSILCLSLIKPCVSNCKSLIFSYILCLRLTLILNISHPAFNLLLLSYNKLVRNLSLYFLHLLILFRT